MKRGINLARAIAMIALSFLFVLGGCTSPEISKKDCRVTFNLNYENYIGGPSGVTVKEGDLVNEPEVPLRAGYMFLGWYKEKENLNRFNFKSDKVENSIMLYAKWELNYLTEIPKEAGVQNLNDKNSYEQEESINYSMFFKPREKGGNVGDLMPYYENGKFYMFYLKDEGGSVRHSIYRADTTDFLSYTDSGETLRSGAKGTQDYWIGTGSNVKVGNDYYFFYTGHNSELKIKEKIMVAKSSNNMDNYKKIAEFALPPDSSLSQNDFRDPQAFFNAEKNVFELLITTNYGGKARLVKYSVSTDLKRATYDGVVFTDNNMGFWNLECADIFKIDSTYYLTYSGQDDTVWCASSKSKFSDYGEPKRLEGKLFYAPKSVSDGVNTYLVGWARRRQLADNTSDQAWAGNIVVQKVLKKADGSLVLVPIDGLDKYYSVNAKMFVEKVKAEKTEDLNRDIAFAYESYMLSGEFKFTGTGEFGLVFGHGKATSDYKHIKIDPSLGVVKFTLSDGLKEITRVNAELLLNKTYSFTYIVEGSVGVFYINGLSAITTRIYGENNGMIGVFSRDNNVEFSNLKINLRAKEFGGEAA